MIEKTAVVRVRAGISYALTEAMDDGHCGLPTGELLPLVESLLEVPAELVRTAIELKLAEGTIVADRVGETPCVFLAGCTVRSAASLITYCGSQPAHHRGRGLTRRRPSERLGLAFAESQTVAIQAAFRSKVLVITALSRQDFPWDGFVHSV